ncbi:tRNA-dependent cyclodipeptide synthase [Streptomyces sp. RS10V-4]|uniref:tRNA-dependent cyclodipeptide synthase n=1 Tax=Streptomyces rhizoryzae TaxID=2932493 RepID=UPI002006419F|nr:tRNA-dependent cyclodipeptide synthase [Streptomyces rhizoryzae]MCK7625850.1 tRNA-dependent cyclodipeptide synthase [Streptomyces rhizoryzae]
MEPALHGTDPGGPLHAEPLSEDCRLIWKRGDHALIGVSGGNSYFNQDRLTALLRWAGDAFTEIDVVYVDTHMEEMLVADGHTPERAARSVRSTLKDVRRRIRRSLERLGPEAKRFRVRPLSEVMELPAYRAVRDRAEQGLRTDPGFRDACDRMVRQVVEHRTRTTAPGTPEPATTAAHRTAGLHYVTAEAPLFLDSPAIFDVPSSTLLYHLMTPVTEFLAGRQTGFRAGPGQGYVVIAPPSAR